MSSKRLDFSIKICYNMYLNTRDKEEGNKRKQLESLVNSYLKKEDKLVKTQIEDLIQVLKE